MIRSGLITTCLAAALGFASALALASCGGGSDAKLLSGTTAEEINSNLARVRELATEGECVGAEDAALEVSGQVADLREIDSKLKLALQEGATRLNEVVATCSEEPATEETEQTEPTTAAPPSKEQQKEEEKQQKEEEKLQKDAEKQEEKEQKELEKEEKQQEAEEGPPFGEAKGHDEQKPPPAPPEPPSGGIGPGGEAGG
jgi:septal ring factor EnvC (AmiA/AmiB activator)